MRGKGIWTPNRDKAEFTEDVDLVAEIRNGSREAFSRLVQKYQRTVLRVALKFTRDLATAEDVAQETFLKVFRRIQTFEGRASFKSWLVQIAVNSAKNKLRGRKAQEHVDIDHVVISIKPGLDRHLDSSDRALALRDIVDDLPFRQRTALVLRIYEDLSFKEIASIMECPYDTAKANYRHGLQKLKEQLGPNRDAWVLKYEEDFLTEHSSQEVDA